MAALAVAYNLIFGMTGQLSLFQAASFGLSAYASVLFVTRLQWNFWIALIAAILLVAFVSAIVGAVCFRFKLREFYFAIVTMALSEVLRIGIQNWYDLTNGTLGISFVQKPQIWTPEGIISVAKPSSWYLISLATLATVVILCSRIETSWIGRACSAIRLNEALAESIGINTFSYKLCNFVVASSLAALVGAFYAFFTGFVEPSYLSVTQSLDIISMVLLGGVNSVAGSIVGAFIFTSLPHIIELAAEVRVILYGLILILVILVLPQGLWSLFGRVRDAARVA